MFRASQIYGRPPQAPTRAFQGASALTSTWWEAAPAEQKRRRRAEEEEKKAQAWDADYATTDATSNDSQWTAWDEAATAERKRKRREEQKEQTQRAREEEAKRLKEEKTQRARDEEAKRLKEEKAQRARDEEAKRLKEEATQQIMEDVARMFKEAKEKNEPGSSERAKEKPRDFRKLFKRGQKYLTPPISDATRAFYESLLEEKPKSSLAIKYCVEHGLMGREAHAELFAKYTLIKEQERIRAARARANKWKKLDPRAPAKSPKLNASKTPTQK